MSRVIGLLHPGEMGAAVGAALCATGRDVLWASAGRSSATKERATAAGLVDAGTVDELSRRSDVLLSICPPHGALEVAETVVGAGFAGVFVDANAISPGSARRIAEVVAASGATFVDGGIIGPPPSPSRPTSLQLAGTAAGTIAELFVGTSVTASVVDGPVGSASALKMSYAAWTKGTAALLLAIREVARAERVDDALLAEWARSQSGLPDRLAQAERSAATKGWRWVAEMDEIAATFDGAGMPAGFHEAAADIYRSYERPDTSAE